MFNGAVAMRIERGASRVPRGTMTEPDSALPYADKKIRQGRECFPGTMGKNTHGLHAGGAAHGRGVKRPPCPRPPIKRARGRGMPRFFLSAGSRRKTDANPRGAIPRPRPSQKRVCLAEARPGE